MFDSELVADLNSLEPGPTLATRLASVDVRALSGSDRVTVMQVRARLVAHFEAQLLADMANVMDAVADEMEADPEATFAAGAAEVAAALRLTRRAADSQVGFALALSLDPPFFRLGDLGVWGLKGAKSASV